VEIAGLARVSSWGSTRGLCIRYPWDSRWMVEFAALFNRHYLRSLASLILQSIYQVGPNQALERTADRRENLLSMTSKLRAQAQRALVSGRSAWSR
jgi:hypothetical protein